MTGLNVTASSSTYIYLYNAAMNPVTIKPGVTISNIASIANAAYALVGNQAAYWSIDNSGTLLSVGTSTYGNGDGILLISGASITNEASGRIDGYYFGISMLGSGTVINRGHIDALQTSGAGYSISSTGTFSAFNAGVRLNGGGISNAASGVIASNVDGVLLLGDGAVANAGTIVGSSTVNGIGILLPAGGTVTNALGGTIKGGQEAILSIDNLSVINQGAITGQNGSGIFLAAGGTVSNRASGTISGGDYGLYTRGPATIVNAGVLTGTTVMGAALFGASTLSNASTGFISGGDEAIYANSAASTITNDGILNGGSVAGVLLNAGGSVTNEGTGAIVGQSFGVEVAHGIGNVVNSGTISDTILYNGAGVQLAGGGTVTNSTGGAITSKWIGVQIGASQTASVGGTVVNLGSIFASDPKGDGAGVWIHGPGTVINGATGTIVGGGFGVVAYYQTTLINQGSIGGSEFAFDPAHTGFANRVVDTPGAVFRGTVDGGNTIGSTIVSTLELASASSAGTITGLGSQFVDFGQIVLDAGANWSFGGTVVAGQTIGFGGSHAALTLLNPNEVGATITGFGVSDTIVMPGIANTTGISFNGNTLTVSESVGPNLTLVFGAPQALAFSVVNGATDITVACFAEGTRIQTKTGATLVEALRPGMPVISVFGGDREIVWVGHRRIDCTKHPRPLTVWPIQIEAGAFGPGLPAADLRVSPDHAIYVNEVLIPARHLVNGTTIRQVPVDEVTYYHVELHRHDVLLAEGLPAESYLDTGNRSNFSGSLPVQLFPDFSTPPPNLADVWEAEGCAPLVIYGPELEAAQALVNRHALAA